MSNVDVAAGANTPSTAQGTPVADVPPANVAVTTAAADANAPAPADVVTNETDTTTTAVADLEGEAKGETQEGKQEVVYALKATDGEELDSVIKDAYVPIAKELGLTNEGAQKLIDTIGPVVDAQMLKAQTDMLEAFTKQNVEQCVIDKEFGGADLSKNVAIAEKALAAFGTPALRKLLEETKLSNHPEVIRVFYRAGRAISEDTLVVGERPLEGSPKSAGERLYGKK